ncbi:MAG: pyridoxamine 5'-phosphate oxidase family protein [Chitinophagaceae bacterium]
MENKHIENNQQKAIEKLKELTSSIDMCIFCTGVKSNAGASSRPMSTAGVDDNGNIWFFSDKNSEKNQEIASDSRVQLFYSHPGKSSYMVIDGTATISFDKQKIDSLWTPLAKTWFKEGKDDPNISLIKVSNVNAHYWDTKGNRMVNFLKIIVSAATGKTLIEAEEGNLNVH